MKYSLKEILNLSLDIGERLLKCGAEVSRVEDTIERIIDDYGVKYKEVSVLNAFILVTVRDKNRTYTESRRIKYRTIDLYQLEKLNSLSRSICKDNISRSEVLDLILQYKTKNSRNRMSILLGMILGSSSFTLLFGGRINDALIAGVIAIILFLCDYFVKISHMNNFIYNFFTSFLIGIFAFLFVKLHLAYNIDKIIIGDIMLLIPGLSIFISVDDVFKGDTVSGISRFTEGLFLALVIAGGIGFSLFIGGLI